MGLNYKNSGVDYQLIDPVKKLAREKGLLTAVNFNRTSFKEISQSRGESAYVIESRDSYFAFVIEGLGTKSLVAGGLKKITGKSYYRYLAQDTVAMIVNDLITVGATPLTVNAYWAVGSSLWFKDKKRMSDLINGWKKACDLSGVSWGGGETPVLKDILFPGTIDLAGSAFGIVRPKKRLILGDKLAAGDKIVFLASSGIHANGISFVRKMAEDTPGIYETKLSDGRMFGEAILAPTHLYVTFVRELMEAKLDLHYMVNITGHGWRKLMRATQEFSYIIDAIPEPQPEFTFMQQHTGTADAEMWGNFNMGAGFAVYVPQAEAQKVVDIAAAQGLKALIAGKVQTGQKQVAIKPKNITFTEETLGVRG